jgi:hypothetical protein
MNIEFTRTELETVLLALNVEQARAMRNDDPAERKLVTELRDRIAAEVKRSAQAFSAAVADDKAMSRW